MRNLRSCSWTFQGTEVQQDTDYFVDQEVSSGVFPEAPAVLCIRLPAVQEGFPDLGRNKLAAAQRCISSGIYQCSGSFTASGRKVALRWIYGVGSAEQWEKHSCPPLAGQSVKREGSGSRKPGSLPGMWVEVWGREACCTSEHHLKRISVTDF